MQKLQEKTTVIASNWLTIQTSSHCFYQRTVNFKMTTALPSVRTLSVSLAVLKPSCGATALSYQQSLSYGNRIYMCHGPLAWLVPGTSHWQTPRIEHSGIVWTGRLYMYACLKWRNQIHNLCEEIEFTTCVLDCVQLWNYLWDCKSFSSESSWNFSWRKWCKPISTTNSSTKTCCARTVKHI